MSDLYDQDFIGWTEYHARVLREAAAQGSNLPIDWENLIEEVESLGKAQYDAVASQIRRIIVHLLKLEFSPAPGPRAGWRETVRVARAEIESRLQNDPGLKPRLSEMISRETPRAVLIATEALTDYGEDPAGILTRQRAGTVYSADQILGTWLPKLPGQA